MTGTVRIEFSVATLKRGSEITGIVQYDRDDWDSMTPEEKEEEVQQQAFNCIKWSFSEAESPE